MRLTVFLLSLLLITLSASSLLAQRVSLRNPGFEDRPRHSDTPNNWRNCAFPGYSPPDIMPDYTFGYMPEPYSGRSYLGLIVRDNDTWEGVSAKLTGTLLKDSCYQFQLALCRSDQYQSLSQITRQPAFYTRPARLRIWGTSRRCDKVEMLAESPVIENVVWQIYTFVLRPIMEDYENILIEAYYDEPFGDPYNGNVLVDAASAFLALPGCEMEGFELPSPPSAEAEAIDAIVASEQPIVLAPIDSIYWKNEDDTRFFLSNVLSDLILTEEFKLLPNSFKLEGTERLTQGHPACFALSQIIQQFPDEQWELVIFNLDPYVEEVLMGEILRHMGRYDLPQLTIRAYDPVEDDGRAWFCMSIGAGLYLNRE